MGPGYDSIRLIGLFKEAKYGGEDIRDFAPYFPGGELFLDDENEFYAALGNQKLSFKTWNPFTIISGIMDMSRRMKDRGIDGNMRGEGLTLGGIFVIGPGDQGVRYLRREDTGTPPEKEPILEAVQSLTFSTPTV
uniref:Peroxiredoxin-like 2A n=1 Tax=Pinguiococcus pyrenoidosus TaxID=172671 RepID=A0A7R9UBL2_9STRA|mmetsp:Transcript_2421/g.10273  ORF Transcript_2421/g.10273 Transcript_2421/m.10273 type:complete len:135 (+) Transcript_2421:346-750(+)